MFKNYFKRNKLKTYKLSDERVEADIAAVFARIETEEKNMKNSSDKNTVYVEVGKSDEPQKIYPQKIPVWKRAIPAAAAAALAAAIPFGAVTIGRIRESAASDESVFSDNNSISVISAPAAAMSPTSEGNGNSSESSTSEEITKPTAHISTEYRYSDEAKGQYDERSISTVNVNGRLYAGSMHGVVPKYDADGSMLEALKEAFGVDKDLTYDDLRALPSIGKGRMIWGIALNDLRVDKGQDELYYHEADFCQYNDEVLIMRLKYPDGEPENTADIFDIDATPDEDILYCFLRYSERFTKFAAAVNSLLDEWNGANEAGIEMLNEVVCFDESGVSDMFVEVTLKDGADEGGFKKLASEYTRLMRPYRF